jgi:hypothetical protein
MPHHLLQIVWKRLDSPWVTSPCGWAILSRLVIIREVHIVVSFVATLLVHLEHVLPIAFNPAPHVLGPHDITHVPFIRTLAMPPLEQDELLTESFLELWDQRCRQWSVSYPRFPISWVKIGSVRIFRLSSARAAWPCPQLAHHLWAIVVSVGRL